MEMIIWFIFFISLALLGLIFGKLGERKHYRRIIEREKKLSHILLFNEKRSPAIVAGQKFVLVRQQIKGQGLVASEILAYGTAWVVLKI